MKPTYKILLTSVAVIALAIAGQAHAQTTTTRTVVSQKELPDMQKTNFSAFDLNGDRILSRAEIGEKLFYIFDTDGNEVIDNIEFDSKRVMTIIPMEKETFTFTDWNSGGKDEEVEFTYEMFLKQSMLMRFDNDMDGLSPADFIGMSFLELDDDESKAIELEEWKEEYMVKTKPVNAEQERYN